jgi:ferredoxin-nitrite reductase
LLAYVIPFSKNDAAHLFEKSAQDAESKIQSVANSKEIGIEQLPKLQVDLKLLPACPGLFYGSSAQDGILTRIRIVGGILNQGPSEAIANFSDRYGDGFVQVTNRANFQIRAIQTAIAPDHLSEFQRLGLAAQAIAIDPIRNIMASPTAGIDLRQLIDTRPLVEAWDSYLQSHLEFAQLSPKFSICFDGGELVSVGALRSDITLVAERILGNPNASVGLRLHLNVECDLSGITDIVISPDRAVDLLAALAQVYLDYICLHEKNAGNSGRKPRLRQILSDWGIETYLERVQQLLSFPLKYIEASQKHPISESYPNLGIHAQSQMGFYYLGISLPLGRMTTHQLRSISNLAQTYGSGELRLTPWQNLLITDVPKHQLSVLQAEIAKLGLHTSNHFGSAIVACAGLSGCKSSATHTQTHALEMIGTLAQKVNLDRPINIHFSGCTKSCAQHSKSDIALVGTQIVESDRIVEAYDIFVGSPDLSSNSSFGRLIVRSLPAEEINGAIERMLQAYQRQRISEPSSSQSFRAYVDSYPIPKLQQIFNLGFSHNFEPEKK